MYIYNIIMYIESLSPYNQGFLSMDVPLRVSRPLRVKKNLNLMGIIINILLTKYQTKMTIDIYMNLFNGL